MKFSLVTLLSIAWGAYLVVLVGWIALQKRSPVSTLSWILSLAALPYLGLVIYYFFGPQRLKRTRLRRVGRRKFSGRRQRQIASLARYAENIGSARQLATLIRRSSGAMPTTATAFELLNTGSKTFDALLAAIDAATEHIHLEYYIFEPDRVGRLFREHLIERARAGVKVRLLMDSLGSKGINRRFIAPMLEAGCEVLFFHPVRLRQLRPVINMRTHRKIVICDGRVGFTGGVNITEEEDERLRADAYHDLHLRLEGPVVHALQRVFLEDWIYAGGKEPPLHGLAPDLPLGSHVAQVIPSGPDTDLLPLSRSLIFSIAQATRRVWLTTPYFVPDEPALFALVSAALRGVDVQVLVPRNGDSWLVTKAARSFFGDLTRVGIKVWEYMPGMLHSKTMLIDDDHSYIGTANFDSRSFRLNFELTVLLYGHAAAHELERQFLADVHHARPVPRDRRLKLPARLAEAFARLCSPLL